MANYPLVTFNAGELSPFVDTRSDIDKYRAGCRVLENFIPRIYGPATRRPGTKYIETCDGVARVIPFIYSNEIAYIIMLEDLSAKYYFDGGRVNDVWGRPYKLDTPYLEADLFELQFKQSNDVMWIVHNSYAQRKLSRVSANEFALDQITFTNGPFMRRNDLLNDDGVTMTPSVTTGNGTLTASSATFDGGHVGALFSITQPRAVTSISGSLQATGVLGGASIATEGPCTLNISDGWAGTIELQRSIDNGVTWETRRSFYSNDGKRAIQYAFNEEEDNVLHRINITAYTATYQQQISITDEDGYVGEQTISKTSIISGDLTVDSSTQTGICRVTGFTSSTIVNMTVLTNFASTNSDTRWAEGCWSTYRGFPKSVTFFEERVVYAGTTYQPQTIWFSATDDYENFKAGVNDDDSFSLTISSETRNAIQWVAALEALLIGTSGGEWRIRSSSDDETLTPTNFSIKQQTNYGSADLQALQVGDVILFADFVRRKVRELTYSGNSFKYIAPDLTSLAEHITETGIVDMAFQRNPDPILWCVRGDGTLLSMTYEREQNVLGWSRHPVFTGSVVESSAYLTPPGYPVLQIADGVFQARYTAPTLTQGSAVSTLLDLQHMADDLTGNYYLTNDIDASDTASWNGGLGFEPIGSSGSGTEFAGTLDGGDFTITGLTINRPTSDEVGLFGAIDARNGSDVIIKNLTLADVNITSDNSTTGALVGQIETTSSGQDVALYNVNVSGTISCNGSSGVAGGIGGLVGKVVTGTSQQTNLYDCISSCTVDVSSGPDDYKEIGGLIGIHSSGVTNVLNSRASGNVTGNADGDTILGGMIGTNSGADFTDCSATGNVSGKASVGGFVGISVDGTYTRCSARGHATNTDGSVGGFFGNTYGDTGSYVNSWTDCYAWGNATDTAASGASVGGFGGDINNDTTLTRCYSIGVVSGQTGVIGGFVGYDFGGSSAYTTCYWDTETSGLSADGTDSGAHGQTTEWMQRQSSFERADWDFDSVWQMPATVLYSSLGLGCNSVAVIPSSDEDEIWAVVYRYINGQQVRYLEQFQPRNWGDDEDQWFLDSALDYDGDAVTSLSGLDHLEGETVGIFADGAILPNQTVTNGTITFTIPVSRVIAGLPFRYTLKPMRIDFTSANHTSQTQVKKIGEVMVSFYKSGMVEYGVDTNNLFKLMWRKEEDYDNPPALYTGDMKLQPEGGFSTQDDIIITGNSPINCTVRSIIPRITITGR